MQRFQRYDDQGWFRAGQVEVTTSILLAGLTAVFLLLGVAAPALFREPLAFDSDLVRNGEVWRLVLYPLYTSTGQAIWLILSMVMMVYVGGEIERELRRRRFAWLVGALIVVPVLAATWFPEVAAGGLNRVVSPLFVVLVLWQPGIRTFFNIPLWAVVVLFEALDLLQIFDLRNLGAPIGGLLVMWAVSLAVAALGARAFGLTEFTQIPRIPLPQFVTGDPYTKSNRAREKAQRKAAKGSAPAGGSGGRSGPSRRRADEPAPVIPIRPEARLDRAEQAEMDALLDKISASGVDSLTPDERARLDGFSRRLRGQ